MGRQTFKLRAEANGHGFVAIDGLDISNSVTDVEVTCVVGKPNEVKLRLYGVNLDVEAEVGDGESEPLKCSHCGLIGPENRTSICPSDSGGHDWQPIRVPIGPDGAAA